MLRLVPWLVLGLVACGPGVILPTDRTDTVDTDETDVVETDDTTSTDDTDDTDVVETDDTTPTEDLDGDGYTVAEGDCDDNNDAIYPFAIDVPYDGIDSNCRGDSDYDADYDGHDAEAFGGDDCEDRNAAISPSANDRPYDGTDSDCSGGSDNDGDGDGFDASSQGGTDCNDLRDDIFPGATEVWYDGVDQDCSGGSDYDADADSHNALAHGGRDCNDNDPDVNPNIEDVPYDGTDADCSGNDDYDADGDGERWDAFGGTDCDDVDEEINAAAPELCTPNVDENCDGNTTAGAVDVVRWYADFDGDDVGAEFEVESCVAPPNTSSLTGDCDDEDPNTFPGAPPVACDGIENDCDPSVLEDGIRVTIGAQAYTTLAAAVAAASPGDTLTMCEGAYAAPGVPIDKSLTFDGLGTPETVQIVGSVGSVFEIRTAGVVTLSQLTLRNGTGTDTGIANRGGGIYLGNGGNLQLTDVRITLNHAFDGGGLWVGQDAVATGVNVQIDHNLANNPVVGQGGGVVLDRRGRLTLTASSVVENEADVGGGLWLGIDAVVTGTGSTVTGNVATLTGGGVSATRGGATLIGLTVADNEAATGGGVDIAAGELFQVMITGNEATLRGGGVHAVGVNAFEDVDVVGNLSGIEAGGIDVVGSSVPAPGVYSDDNEFNDPVPALSLVRGSVKGNLADDFLGTAGGLVLTSGAITMEAVDWGTGSTNSPSDLSLTSDQRTYTRTGVITGVCVDGTNEGCF